MKVLMTGSTGYLGGKLVNLLVHEGHDVHCLVRPSSHAEGLLVLPSGPQLWVHDGRVKRMLDIVGQVKPDQVIHMASMQSYEHEPEDIDQLCQSNMQLGLQLAEAAASCGCERFINTASYWEFGDVLGDGVPISLYASLKRAFRETLNFYQVYKGLDVVNLVLYDTYGPGDMRGKIISHLTNALKTGLRVGLSPGEQRLYLTHVDDVCQAYLHALGPVDCLSGSCFSVCPEAPVSLREVVACLEKVSGREVPVVWGRNPYAERQIMEPVHFERLAGWQTQISLTEGLAELISSEDFQRGN